MKPRSLRLYGERWRVAWERANTVFAPEYTGMTQPRTKTITLPSDVQSPGKAERTLLHELLHVALEHMVGKHEEALVEHLENALWAQIADNPSAWDWIVEGARAASGRPRRAKRAR